MNTSTSLFSHMMSVKVSYMSFGSWLMAARNEKGYSLRELERRINKICTFSYLNQLEKGVRGKKGNEYLPDLEIVDALAVALDRPTDEARLAAGYAPANGAANPLLDGFDELTPEDQELAARQIKSLLESFKGRQLEQVEVVMAPVMNGAKERKKVA